MDSEHLLEGEEEGDGYNIVPEDEPVNISYWTKTNYLYL